MAFRRDDAGNARLVEIWNGPWRGDSHNEAALALWYDWLNQGLRLAATAGSRTPHGRHDYAERPGFNVIYAEALTEATAALDALRAGRLYLSAGPQLAFEAEDGRGAHWSIGDTVEQPATFTARWSGCPADAQIRLIANGRLLRQWQAGEAGETALANNAGRGQLARRGASGQRRRVCSPSRTRSFSRLTRRNPKHATNTRTHHRWPPAVRPTRSQMRCCTNFTNSVVGHPICVRIRVIGGYSGRSCVGAHFCDLQTLAQGDRLDRSDIHPARARHMRQTRQTAIQRGRESSESRPVSSCSSQKPLTASVPVARSSFESSRATSRSP